MSLQTTKERIQNEIFSKTSKNTITPTIVGSILNEISDLTIPIDSGSAFPAPYLDELIPDSYLPNNRGDFVLRGSFFTEESTVSAVGQTVHYVTFVSDNELRANITTGIAEGNFDVIVNNGVETVSKGAMLVSYGNVTKPNSTSWAGSDASLGFSNEGEVNISAYNDLVTGTWSKVLDFAKTWRIQFGLQKSPLGDPMGFDGSSSEYHFNIINEIDKAIHTSFSVYKNSGQVKTYSNIPTFFQVYPHQPFSFWSDNKPPFIYEFRCENGVLYIYVNASLKYTSNALTQNMLFQINLKLYDIINIKYIEIQ